MNKYISAFKTLHSILAIDLSKNGRTRVYMYVYTVSLTITRDKLEDTVHVFNCILFTHGRLSNSALRPLV